MREDRLHRRPGQCDAPGGGPLRYAVAEVDGPRRQRAAQ